MDTAQEYAQLANDQTRAQAIYQTIRQEYELTVQEVLKVACIERLMQENPVIAIFFATS